jgi:IclR family acetate operon transcriptional repressor
LSIERTGLSILASARPLRQQEDYPVPAAETEKSEPETAEKGDGGVRAVERALDVLAAFAPGDEELLVADLLKRVGLSRPTLYRLLHTLEKKGFVVSSGEPQRFRLGSSVARLAHVWSSSMDLTAVARPFMLQAWSFTSETVALFVPRGDMRLCLAEMQSPQPLSFRRGVGYSEKLVRGASGRAILAFTALQPGQLEAYAAGTSADIEWLRGELTVTRDRGYAMGHNELIQGAYAVAAPFFAGDGSVAGSLGVFGPDVRLTEARVHAFGQFLKQAGGELSKTLGTGQSS